MCSACHLNKKKKEKRKKQALVLCIGGGFYFHQLSSKNKVIIQMAHYSSNVRNVMEKVQGLHSKENQVEPVFSPFAAAP